MSKKQIIKWVELLFYPLVSISVFLLLWYFGVANSKLSIVMPGPWEVIAGFVRSFYQPIGKYTMPVHIMYSLMRVLPAFFIGAATGIVMGILMGWYPRINAVIRPLYEMIRPIPPIAWIPISIVWFGIGEGSKWFLIFLATFVPITLNAYAGATTVDTTLIKCSRMLGASERQIFTSVVLPYSVPNIFAGLQVGLAAAWATVVAAEMIRSTEGVGWIIISSMDTNDVTQSLIGIVGIGIVGFILAIIMRKTEDVLCRWNRRES